MIKVKVDRNDAKRITAFSMSGHADSGPYGYDLVCAGASAVSFGTVNAIDALCEVELDVDMEDEGGYIHCAVPSHVTGHVSGEVQLLLEGMLVSLQTIADEYSDHIKISD
ncbi:ribosomal-processing cysteine protease Prp [Salibacterium salarium]|uniref:Ribosomal processing cysteine protease Prp n=1 Tax=Salibacterium salarium TaxID=284579 RepID=A0A3R9Q3C0_9BACI|nr:ribosomal-processing cysteine protease Prp [Salibacterium salarium]RSL32701.1 ribosomal-processing cysteine protease Prp [Salibacterium salarium]